MDESMSRRYLITVGFGSNGFANGAAAEGWKLAIRAAFAKTTVHQNPRDTVNRSLRACEWT